MKIVSIIDKIPEIKILFSCKSIYPDVHNNVINTNTKSIEALHKLLEVVEKAEKIGIEIPYRLYYDREYIVVRPKRHGSLCIIEILAPEKYREVLRNLNTVDVLRKILGIAEDEKKKSENELKMLIENGLATVEE